MAERKTQERPRTRYEDLLGIFNRAGFESALAPVLKPAELEADRFLRIALNVVRDSPELQKCDPYSIMGAIMEAAELGLELGTAAWAYLVPFAKECQLIAGYRGLIQLAYRSGMVRRFPAGVVFKGDDFDFMMGSEEWVRHKPKFLTREPSDITHAWALAETVSGGVVVRVFDRKMIEERRKRNPAVRKQRHSAWDTDYAAMAMKCPVRELHKFVPASPKLARLATLDEMYEMMARSQGLAWGRGATVVDMSGAGPSGGAQLPAPPDQAAAGGPHDPSGDAESSGRRMPIRVPAQYGNDALVGQTHRVVEIISGEGNARTAKLAGATENWKFQANVFQVEPNDIVEFLQPGALKPEGIAGSPAERQRSSKQTPIQVDLRDFQNDLLVGELRRVAAIDAPEEGTRAVASFDGIEAVWTFDTQVYEVREGDWVQFADSPAEGDLFKR